MTFDNSDIYRSSRRSDLRNAIVASLHEHGELHVALLAQLCGVDAKVVGWAVDGHPPQYSEVLSLRRVGLVRWQKRAGGRSLRLTQDGARLGEALRAASRRRG